MKAYVCDVCHTGGEPNTTMDLPPAGWWVATQYEPKLQTRHLCSLLCMERFAKAEVTSTADVGGMEVRRG